MKIKEMPPYVFKHKPVLYCNIFCLICVVFLIAQTALMNRTVFDVIFLFLIPGVAIVCFAAHGITMAQDRPTMLILMPLTYLLSLLVNELIAVEIGVMDTYPYVPLIEIVPLFFFSFTVATNKGKRITEKVLLLWEIGGGVSGVVLVILAIFFNAKITHQYNNIKASCGLVCGIIAVVFQYLAMGAILPEAGLQTEGLPFLMKRKDYLAKQKVLDTDSECKEINETASD